MGLLGRRAVLVLLGLLLSTAAWAQAPSGTVILSTTTSTQDSGLLDVLVPLFEKCGATVGRDVFLVSISVDPATDTPAVIKEYSKKFHAKPGWMFLTGKKENVDWALYKVGQYVEDKQDHMTVIIVGNEATGLWKKALGMAKPAELIQIVESVANDKGESKPVGGTN